MKDDEDKILLWPYIILMALILLSVFMFFWGLDVTLNAVEGSRDYESLYTPVPLTFIDSLWLRAVGFFTFIASFPTFYFTSMTLWIMYSIQFKK